MLAFRLEELYDIVDYFVIVELTKTHTGKDKELYFENNKKLFEKYMDKIIHVIEPVPNNLITGEDWIIEFYHRKCISKGIDRLNLENGDLLIISDADEIINREVLKDFRKTGINQMYKPYLHIYYYNLRCKLTGGNRTKWKKTKIVDYKTYCKTYKCDCQKIRDSEYAKKIENGGWHFSFFGNVGQIQDKINNVSEHNLFNDKKSIEHINSCIENNRDILHRNNWFSDIDPEANEFLPINYKMLL